ncbi:hypothetical protein [Nonomuraea dietziae]|uniref:hypothetical protein n=1 Tax=Nonomuraea dietziae TaxID=65515 RepID=UPI0031D8A592
MSSDFLFATWAGGGAVPPVLSVARALRERGHGVRVLADRSLHEEVAASGVEPIAWTTAPQGDASDPVKDVIKDFEARTPLGEFARLRDRIVCGPAADYRPGHAGRIACPPGRRAGRPSTCCSARSLAARPPRIPVALAGDEPFITSPHCGAPPPGPASPRPRAPGAPGVTGF